MGQLDAPQGIPTVFKGESERIEFLASTLLRSMTPAVRKLIETIVESVGIVGSVGSVGDVEGCGMTKLLNFVNV